MISLPFSTTKLSALLAGAAATTNPDVTVFYHIVQTNAKNDTGQYPIGFDYTQLNGTNETTILGAPDTNTCTHIDEIYIYNADTAAVTVSVILDDNTSNRILIKKALAVGQSLVYNAGAGWQIV